jgi:predicted nucleotidyltransferase
MDAASEQRIAAFGAAMPELAAVWLFGSQAQGTSRPDSDVDLAFLFREGRAPQDVVGWSRQIYAELAALGIGEIDVVVLDHADPVLRRQVFEKGRPLWIGDRWRVIGFRVLSWMEYLDLEPYRQRVLKAKAGASGASGG